MIDGRYFEGVLIFDPQEAKCDPIHVYGKWNAKNILMPDGVIRKVWTYNFGINDEICTRGDTE